MTKINDGGPAFPHMMTKGHADYATGMSMRDYFAIHADLGKTEFGTADELSKFAGIAIPIDPTPADLLWVSAVAAAKIRYLFADAMLKAREVTK